MLTNVADEAFDKVVQFLGLIGFETQVKISMAGMLGLGPVQVRGQYVPGDV